MKLMEMAREFHEQYDCPIADAPGLPSREEMEVRWNLLYEEWGEYSSEDRGRPEDDDLVAIAKELADMVYVIAGTALVYGFNLDDVLAEVHRSNMTKLGADGKPIYRADGKVMKGPSYEEARVGEIIFGEVSL
jgi:predicted HAD superfamily Cof-like phosphohydrolase